MASLDQIGQALQRADAAGDTEAAQQLAQAYKAAQAQQGLSLTVNPNGATALPRQSVQTQPDALGSPADMGNALAHHLGNLPLGAAQLALRAPSIGQALGVVPDNYLGEQTVNNAKSSLDQYIQNREQKYQQDVPTNASSFAGAAIGEVAPWMLGLGELRAAGLLPEATTTLGKVGALSSEGGLMGALSPVTQQGNYGRQKAAQIATGAVLAPVVAGGAKVAGKVAGAATNAARMFTPKGQEALADSRLAKILAPLGSSGDVAAQLEAAPRYFPGEKVSIAQALQDPEQKALQIERVLRNNPNAGPPMQAASDINNAQRLGILQQLGGTDERVQAAKDARKAATQPFIDENLAPQVPLTRWTNAAQPLDALLEKPGRLSSGDMDALRQARKIVAQVKGGTLQEDDGYDALKELEQSVSSKKAQDAFQGAFAATNKGMIDPSPVLDMLAKFRNTGIGARATIRPALDKISAAIKESKNTRGLVPADVMDSIRQNIGDYIVTPNGIRATPQEVAALGPVKDQLVKTIEQYAPGYSDYLATYAKGSVPINTMVGVRKLLDANARGGLDASGDKIVSADTLKAFLRGNERQRYPIDPEAQTQIEALRNSAAREGISNNKISTKGSDTQANLAAALNSPISRALMHRVPAAIVGDIAGRMLGIPGAGEVGALVGYGVGDIASRLNGSVAEKVGQRAADAQAAAAALRRAGVPPSRIKQILTQRFSLLPYQNTTQAILQR